MNDINEWIEINIILPMNAFAKKHPDMPLVISLIALAISIIAPLLK